MRARTVPFILAAACLALAGCGPGGGRSAGADGAAPPPAPSPGPLPAPPALTAGEHKLLAELPAAYQDADVANGRLHFMLCRTCHTVTQGAPNMTGPNLYGVFGRRVASAPGYSYSPALAARDWIWDAPHLDGWLRSPRTYVPGTKMSFYGISDDADRRDLIAYLKLASSGDPM